MPETYFLKATVILIILLVSFYFILKSPLRLPVKSAKNKKIRILDLTYLTKDNIIALIKVENSKILIGINGNTITKLKEWTNEATEKISDINDN